MQSHNRHQKSFVWQTFQFVDLTKTIATTTSIYTEKSDMKQWITTSSYQWLSPSHVYVKSKPQVLSTWLKMATIADNKVYYVVKFPETAKAQRWAFSMHVTTTIPWVCAPETAKAQRWAFSMHVTTTIPWVCAPYKYTALKRMNKGERFHPEGKVILTWSTVMWKGWLIDTNYMMLATITSFSPTEHSSIGRKHKKDKMQKEYWNLTFNTVIRSFYCCYKQLS